jgi:hypothetical protein
MTSSEEPVLAAVISEMAFFGDDGPSLVGSLSSRPNEPLGFGDDSDIGGDRLLIETSLWLVVLFLGSPSDDDRLRCVTGFEVTSDGSEGFGLNRSF